MSDTDATELCDCPNDCDETRYSYSVSSTALDVDRLCRESEKLYTGDVTGLDPNPQPFMGNYEQLVNDRLNGRDDNCKRNLRSMAFVQFQLVSQTVTQIKREERVTLSDHVSNFGKGQKCC